MNKTSTTITGIGGYLPAKRLSNDDLAKTIDTSHEWIFGRTGIVFRHIAAENEYTSDLAAQALQHALDDAKCNASALDAVIVATTTPDLVLPSTAALVQSKVGIGNCMAFDLNAVCSGFIYGLVMADSLIQSGQAEKVAVIGAETMSRIIDWQDRSTCVLFGDGAGALILERQETATSRPHNQSGIIATSLHCDGNLHGILQTPGGIGHPASTLLQMQGREVFRHGVEKMLAAITETLEKAAMDKQMIDLMVPHQANVRMLKAISERLGTPGERCIITVDKHANTAAASIPLALHWAKTEGLLQPGRVIAMPAAGAGFTWGNVLMRI